MKDETEQQRERPDIAAVFIIVYFALWLVAIFAGLAREHRSAADECARAHHRVCVDDR